MLSSNPKERPTAREALQYAWFVDEHVILTNLLHMNDFLSNTPLKLGLNRPATLIKASQSSFNIN